MKELVECPFCYHSPAVVCCALCGSQGKIPKAAAEEYKKVKDPTVDDRIKIRQKYTSQNEGNTGEKGLRVNSDGHRFCFRPSMLDVKDDSGSWGSRT